mgnify:CR=1 FL=1
MAQRKVDEQVVEHFLKRYFDKDGHPNLFRLSLPTHDGDPEHCQSRQLFQL